MASDDLLLLAMVNLGEPGIIRDVPISQLYATQFAVKRKMVRKYLTGREVNPIHVVEVKGAFVVLDGHRRVTAWQLDGQINIRALVHRSRAEYCA